MSQIDTKHGSEYHDERSTLPLPDTAVTRRFHQERHQTHMSTPTSASAFRSSKWFKLVWIVPVAAVVIIGAILIAKGIRASEGGASFIKTYPGEYEPALKAPVGFPAWLAWQHFLNSFFILLIIRTGLEVRRTTRPAAYWTRNNNGIIKTKNPPTRISLSLWFHLCLDFLWVVNGILFFVLIFTTGQWIRLVPTSWDVFPNALSALIQYVSFDWPTENGWINFNSLQQLTYFATVFIAGPLAFITGIRLSPAWSSDWKRASKIYPVGLARAIHFPTMIYFVAFVIVHVTLVLATNALRNLNHMYGGRDDYTWVGFFIFLGSLVVMAAAWIAARPLVLRALASTFGKIGR
ncbi:MAG: hypothetical protein JWO10_279 [Microbacteriaceae bacterium]|nr:hypothetical protein [Microbacteriaceae bacterium]